MFHIAIPNPWVWFRWKHLTANISSLNVWTFYNILKESASIFHGQFLTPTVFSPSKEPNVTEEADDVGNDMQSLWRIIRLIYWQWADSARQVGAAWEKRFNPESKKLKCRFSSFVPRDELFNISVSIYWCINCLMKIIHLQMRESALWNSWIRFILLS